MSDKPRIRLNGDGSYRLDAWQNDLSGMGVPGMDKTNYTRFTYAGNRIDWRTLSLMYRYDWLTRKICDRPAKDAVRRWIKIEDERATEIQSQLSRLHVKRNARRALSWSRLFGGSALLLIVEDGMTSADPLNPSKVKRVVEVKPVDRWHLQPGQEVFDPYAVEFGKPEYYTTDNGTVFHHTRVLQFNGADLTIDQAQVEHHWGGSYVELYADAVKQFQGSMQDIRHVMTEQGIGVLRIPGLTQSAAMGGTIFNTIQKRLDSFNASKSMYRTAAMDKEEEFDFKTRQISGLDSLLDRFMTSVSGATEIPELVLFGKSPSGLNASQEEILSVYYDMVRSIQEDDLDNALHTILACMNGGVVPEWEYVPLLEPSEVVVADIRSKEAQAIASVAEYAMLSPETVVEHLNNTGHFNLKAAGQLSPDDLEDLV